jgi:hypothetical protein
MSLGVIDFPARAKLEPGERLTQIGDEAARHCGDVIGIGRISVAVRARCAGATATTGAVKGGRGAGLIAASNFAALKGHFPSAWRIMLE